MEKRPKIRRTKRNTVQKQKGEGTRKFPRKAPGRRRKFCLKKAKAHNPLKCPGMQKKG